ncbi:MAG: YecA family protein [Nitrospinaceae bacterium]
MEAYSTINHQESANSLMTFRFEEERFKNLYVLEDYYCTNPFCDCNHVTLSLADRENDGNRFSFLLNFNKGRGSLPNQQKLTPTQESIVKEFMEGLGDEMMVLFKQRYLEAKAYGEKNPMSYLVFEPGKFINYMELFPRARKLLDFDFQGGKHFVEDSYELDPRNDNRTVRMAFYKFDPNEEKLPPIFHYTYHFNEKNREAFDEKLPLEHADLLVEFTRFIPNLFEVLKTRYKEAKKIGEELLDSLPDLGAHKVMRNEMCPCGSGKKYKKCCGLKVH